MKIGKLTTKAVRGYFEVYLNGQHFVNLYKIDEGFGRGLIKDGEWVINRGPLAINKGFFFPPVSYPKVIVTLTAIESMDLPA